LCEDKVTMNEKKRLRVAVLFGGRSAEHEVSIASAASVIRALDPEKYEVVPIGINKEGRWLAGGGAQKLLAETIRQGKHVLLAPEPGTTSLLRLGGEAAGAEMGIDVVFPVLHGTYGEDGTIQGLLELANLPYVGCGVLASSVGMDKEVQKRLFEQAGLPVVKSLTVPRSRWEREREQVLSDVQRKFRLPVILKPATLGSSVGITKAHDAEELAAGLDLASEFAQKILVERAVDAREIEISVLGNEEPRASIPGEILPHHEFYDYAAKYTEEGTKLAVPAVLKPRQTKKLQNYAIRAFQAIEGRGMARVDFFLERQTGRIYLNEINTIPGFTSISMYPRLWQPASATTRQPAARFRKAEPAGRSLFPFSSFPSGGDKQRLWCGPTKAQAMACAPAGLRAGALRRAAGRRDRWGHRAAWGQRRRRNRAGRGRGRRRGRCGGFGRRSWRPGRRNRCQASRTRGRIPGRKCG
jgi:D-alanine-D-alanine ligase